MTDKHRKEDYKPTLDPRLTTITADFRDKAVESMMQMPSGLPDLKTWEKDVIDKRIEELYPRILNALSNETRRTILSLFEPGQKKSFSELATAFPDKTAPTIARHLSILCDAELLRKETHSRDIRIYHDRHYAFYIITPLGEYISKAFPEAVRYGVELDMSEWLSIDVGDKSDVGDPDEDL